MDKITQNNLILPILTAFVLLLTGLFFWAFRTEKRLKRFFLGKKGMDLEDKIQKMEEQLANLEKFKMDTQKELASANEKIKKGIRDIQTIRFNPFPDQGSNQSFAIGMLNDEGDGVVLSSLYSRDRMSVFAKPINKGRSEYDLTNEEREVLEKAKI